MTFGKTRKAAVTFLMGATLFAGGCYRNSTRKAKVAEPAATPAATQQAKPTTQELISGPHKKVPLPNMPLSVQVPQGWKIDTTSPVTFLTGPTPYDQGTISLSGSEAFTFDQSQLDALVARAAAEAEKQPPQYRREEWRQVGGLRILERRYQLKPVTRNKLDEKGDALLDDKGNFITTTTTPVQWTLTAFLPMEKAYTRYELEFIDLDVQQLAVDDNVLSKIFASIQPEGLSPPPTTATAPAQ